MRVLITGGTGFIGSRLGHKCLQQGHSVVVLGQENTPAESQNKKVLEQEGAEIVLGSVTEREKILDLLSNVDVVYHLAAIQHEMNIPDQSFWDVNVLGTKNLLEVSVTKGIRRFVHGSTIGVYRSLRGTIDESSLCRPDSIYGVTKLEGEKVVLSFKDKLQVVVIRIPEVYGPGDRRLLKLFRTIQKKIFFMIGDGKNLHHPIYIDDLIGALLAAAKYEKAVGEILLIAGKETVTTENMVATIADQLGAKIPRFRAPLSLFWVIAAVAETLLRPLGIQPPIHRRRMDFFRKSFTLSGAKAFNTLDFVPKVSFREGVRETAKWYRQMGYLE